MAWTAAVIKKEIIDGIASVTVQYTDGVKTIIDPPYTSVNPTADWIPQKVASRIAYLSGVYAFDIALGPVVPKVSTIDANEYLFKQRVYMLLLVKTMIDLGAVDIGNTKVQALITWLKNNFNTYFETL